MIQAARLAARLFSLRMMALHGQLSVRRTRRPYRGTGLRCKAAARFAAERIILGERSRHVFACFQARIVGGQQPGNGDNRGMMASDPRAIRNKVSEFRDRAEKTRLKAAATSERTARRMFEDAARQFEEMADKLEETGRPY